jgi:hypothetical protein
MSETPRPPGRTLIVQPKKAELVLGPHDMSVETIFSDALSILANEITILRKQSNAGKGLDLAQARVLTGYIKSLTDIRKELREADSERDLANMTDSELLQLVEQLRKNKEAQK